MTCLPARFAAIILVVKSYGGVQWKCRISHANSRAQSVSMSDFLHSHVRLYK
jgi:hypothetical protein